MCKATSALVFLCRLWQYYYDWPVALVLDIWMGVDTTPQDQVIQADLHWRCVRL